MKFHGIDCQGKFHLQRVASLPAFIPADEGRLIYTEDVDKIYYATNNSWKEIGVSGPSSESDMYSDLLSNSIYFNCSFDPFSDADLVAPATTMTFVPGDDNYTWSGAQVLQSIDIFDTESGLTSISPIIECVPSIDFSLTSGSANPTIEVTADGVNWENASNNVLHTFSNTGIDLRIRITSLAGTSGEVDSYGIFYNVDSTQLSNSPSRRKTLTTYYEGVCVDEQDIFDGYFFDNAVWIDGITINTRIAPSGSNLTIDLLKDGVEQSKFSSLTDGNLYEKTSILPIAYSTTERFGLKIKSVGSTNAGQGLTAIISYYDR